VGDGGLTGEVEPNATSTAVREETGLSSGENEKSRKI